MGKRGDIKGGSSLLLLVKIYIDKGVKSALDPFSLIKFS